MLNFADVSPADQVAAVEAASVFIGVHGSELTNVIWLRPGSVVIEVILRYGWCCDMVPRVYQGYEAPPCTGCSPPSPWDCPDGLGTDGCKAYHKADIANLAHGLVRCIQHNWCSV